MLTRSQSHNVNKMSGRQTDRLPLGPADNAFTTFPPRPSSPSAALLSNLYLLTFALQQLYLSERYVCAEVFRFNIYGLSKSFPMNTPDGLTLIYLYERNIDVTPRITFSLSQLPINLQHKIET